MDFDNLNKEQLAAATYNGKHLLVLAGAGTGKTRTIIARALHLISTGVQPTRIKILSFTKKSAQEIANRIKIEGSKMTEAKQVSGSTFHSWCMDLITRYGSAFGLEGYSCIDEEDRESAISIAIGNLYNKKKIQVGKEQIKGSQLSDIYSYAVNTRQNLSTAIKMKLYPMQSGELVDINVRRIKELIEPVIRAYIEYKRSRHYIDYDDMLMAVASILKQNIELKAFVSSLYDHILIDEMQDTNPLQWMLLESFMENCHLFCVGDDAQSIYAFRGADFKSIHSFVDRVPNSDVYKLEENYRSTQEILDLSNWLLDESPLNYDKHLFAHRGKGQKPIMQFINNDWEEAEFITDNILSNIADGLCYKSHMVLSRTILGTRKVEAACISKKIPCIVYGGTGLLRTRHVRDVVSALRIIANFRDELAWMRYLKLWQGVGDVMASSLIEKMFAYSTLQECVEIVKSSGIKDDTSYKLLEELIPLDHSPEEAISVAVKRLDKTLSRLYKSEQWSWEDRKKDFDALKLVAKQSNNLSSFITEYILDPIAELSKVLAAEDDNDKVVISTIHSAKGLEADICYVVSVMPGIFPSHKATSEDDIEEERRCLYVALTRAKDKLYLMTNLNSNAAIRDSRNIVRRIAEIDNETNTGLLCGTIQNYNKQRELVSTTICYKLDSQPSQTLEMEETEFWKKFKRAATQHDEERAYFFNNLPDDLVEKVMAERQGIPLPRFPKRATKEFNPLDNFDFS
ncbi:MAG: ATP-dependent helicase [Tidjanibacter sp.]|nr:ATP-dependent helicase [Tidjanibacter sp.]